MSDPTEIKISRIEVLDPVVREEAHAIFPNDELRDKRISNLKKSDYILLATQAGSVAGVLFIRNILGIPNATWIVAATHRRKGIAFKLLKRAQEDKRLITAISRNTPSRELARKAGFRQLPFGVGIWTKLHR